jgi:hypothetical protein
LSRLLYLAAALACAGCRPDFGKPASLVVPGETRILAVRGEPAEVSASTPVAFTTLVVTHDGADTTSPIDWSFCTSPKPLDENNIVADSCLTEAAVNYFSIATPSAMGTTPIDVCQRFGPDPPPQETGKPPLRPRDPDVTGGFYQPVRVERDRVVAFGLERIICNLASAGAEVAIEFRARYKPNTNPKLASLSVAGATLVANQPAMIPAGKPVTFTASWGAESAEGFPVYDVAAQKLVDHRESMRVSWFATDGTFEHDRTGRGEEEMDTTTDNSWTPPTNPGPVHLWVVLRDSRGGVDFQAYELEVTP